MVSMSEQFGDGSNGDSKTGALSIPWRCVDEREGVWLQLVAANEGHGSITKNNPDKEGLLLRCQGSARSTTQSGTERGVGLYYRLR